MKRTGLKRGVALVMCFFLLAAAFLSIAYLAENQVHACSDNDCGTCVQLRLAEGLLRQLGTALAGVFLLRLFAVPGLWRAALPSRRADTPTLVSLKVRFNN